jgi:hypothetical protein
MQRTTTFSPCRRYRYTLWRDWSDLATPDTGYLMVIGLNPSTADETDDDPTIRKCKAFARQFGYTSLCMTNLFAWRDTDPAKMKKAEEPIGPDNDTHLLHCAAHAGMILAAWGKHGAHRDRAAAVVKLLAQSSLHALRLNNDGSPEHPLYIPYTVQPVPFPPL